MNEPQARAPVDDDLWSAIGDPTRRRMLDLLVDGEGTAPPRSVDQLPVTRQAVAKHLAVLDRVGLVRADAGGSGEAVPGRRRPAALAVAAFSSVGVGVGRQAPADQADRRDDPAHEAGLTRQELRGWFTGVAAQRWSSPSFAGR